MEKGKTKNNSILRLFAVLFLLVFCGCFLVGCINMGVGSSGGSTGGSSGGTSGGSSSGSTGGSNSDSDDSKKNPYAGASENIISNFNDLFMGAVGVYEVDSNQEIFYDEYTSKYVSFNYLINRQFETLASIIYDGLNYAYGDNSFNGNLSNYGSNNISYTYDKVISETIYNRNGSLKYANSMNGGYKLEITFKEPELDGDGNPVYDSNGDQIYDIVIEYTDTIVSERKWNKILTSSNDLVAPLKYIYLNTQTPTSMSSFNLTEDASLKNYYKSFNGSLTSNENITNIGFSEEYLWNVLYYLAYSVIGEVNIQNSIDSLPYVFNGTQMQPITEDSYPYFEKYKAYDKVLISLVENVFSMVKNGNNVDVSDNYCYSGVDWDKTLYPILMKYEYVFFDDLNDICDAESSGVDDSSGELFDPETFVPDSNYSPSIDPDFDFNEDEIDSTIVLKAGSLKKLKEIILLPTINKLNYNKTEFAFESISIDFATANDTTILVNILTDACGKETSNNITNMSVEFFDGTFDELVMPDGTIIKPDKEQKESTQISKDGYFIVNKKANESSKEVESTSINADLFGEKEMQFSSVEFSNNINSLFNSDSYVVPSTSEEINIARLKVCNNLFGVDLINQTYNLNIDKNYIKLAFEYYDSNGNQLSEIPAMYLMDFSISE